MSHAGGPSAGSSERGFLPTLPPNNLGLDAGPSSRAQASSVEAGVHLVHTDAAGHGQSLRDTLAGFLERHGKGVVVAANRPAASLRDALRDQGVAVDQLRFVDCVASVAGQPTNLAAHDTTYVESPHQLEALALRAEMVARRHGGFLLVDSLSSLALYNGVPAVHEWTQALVMRLRARGIPSGLVVVGRSGNTELLDAVRPLCDTGHEASSPGASIGGPTPSEADPR